MLLMQNHRHTRMDLGDEQILYLESGGHEEQLEKLADQFILGDLQIINSAFFVKAASGILSRMEV